MPSMKPIASRAASSMSQRWAASASSGCIDHSQVPLDRPAAEGVGDLAVLDDVYIAPKELSQFVVHSDQVQEADGSAWCEPHHDIDVTVRAVVVADDGAEEGKFFDAPLPAKGSDILRSHVQGRMNRGSHSTMVAEGGETCSPGYCSP